MSEENKNETPKQGFLPFGLKLPVQFTLGCLNNSQQRKEESLKLLKEWARDRTDLFDSNREIIEELVASVDLRARLSVDFLQIVYKFFHEKFLQEQQYSSFLLTKPQHNMKNNFMGQHLYLNITGAINHFEELNLAQCSRAALFAQTIDSKILNAEIFTQFAELDKKSNILLSAIIVQQKLLSNYMSQAGSKLNRIIPLFAQQERPRKKIFEDITGTNIQNAFLNGITNLVFKYSIFLSIQQGTLFLGPQAFQDPVEAELNRQLKQQARVGERKEEQKVDLSENDSTDQKIDDQPQKIEQDVNDPPQKIESPQKIEQDANDQKETEQKTETLGIEKKALESDEQIIEKQQQEVNTQQQQLTNAQNYQKQKSKNYQQPTNQKMQQNDQDLYHIMLSYINSQVSANKTIGTLAEKVIAYWDHVEKCRAQWVSESCKIYSEQYAEVYQTLSKIDLNLVNENDVEKQYGLQNLFPKEIYDQMISKHPNLQQDQLLDVLRISDLPCNAPRLLVIKEFKVFHVLPTSIEVNAHIVITIDRYVGCWDRLEDLTIENVDSPNFHLPIGNMALLKQGPATIDIMPSKHYLFVNIANDKQKCRLRFSNPDDMEEFCTIVQ